MLKKFFLVLCFLLVPMQIKPLFLETMGLVGLVAMIVKGRMASVVRPHVIRFSKEAQQKTYVAFEKMYQALPQRHVHRIEQSKQVALMSYQKMLSKISGKESVTVQHGRLGYTQQTNRFNYTAHNAESTCCGKEAFGAKIYSNVTQNNFVQNHESKALVHSMRSLFGQKVTHNYYQANPHGRSDYWKGFAIGSNMSWGIAWMLSGKSDRSEEK